MAGGVDDAHEGGALRATFHYTDGERETRANLLLQHLQSAEQVVVLQGDPGSGRTHLLRRILARSDHGLRIYAVHSEAGLTQTDLLLGLLEHLQLPAPPSEAPDRIRAHTAERLTALASAGERPVLALDDADVLGDDLLESLLSFRDDTRADAAPPLGLLLVGSPRVALRLTELAGLAHDRTPVTVALHGLDRAATRAFLAQALKADGDADGHLLESLDIDAIAASSGGRPGAILDAARRQLAGDQPAAPAARPSRSFALPEGWLPSGSRRSIGLVSAATVLLVGTLLALSFVADQPSEDEPERIESAEITSADEPVEAPESGDATPPDADATDAGGPTATEEPEAFDTPETYGFGDDESPDDAATEETDEARDLTAETAGESEAETGPDLADTDDAVEESAADATDDDADEAPTAEPEQETETEPASELERALATGRDWRAGHADDMWTIQLVAAHNPEAVRNWMERHADAAELYLLRTQRDGEDWFLVVTGADDNREAARERRDGLPEELQEGGAWIRQFQGIDDS